jgi:excisionase family DNA binding protein
VPAAEQIAEPWVSVEAVAAHLGVRKDSIYRWIEHRGLPAHKIGKLWKLKLSEVDAWVRARGASGGPVPAKRAPERIVLVIDDDALIRDTLHDFLSDEGYVALLASDGAEALKLLASASPRPSLIILDLNMPNVDGWKFREEQARDPDLAAIPVIVVTAVLGASLGDATVLRKPLRLDQLANAIDMALMRTPRLPPTADSAGKKLTIVVVDDSEDNVEILAELLGELGHRVLTASSGAGALELLDQSLPDVVLLDIGLPDINGYEVATTIRTRFGDTVRLIAVTGFSAAAAREQARRAGFDAFLVKPYHVEEIEAALIPRAP